MDGVKEAFNRVKKDIGFLKFELDNLRKELVKTRQTITDMGEIFKEIHKKRQPTHRQRYPTYRRIKQTNNTSFKPLKPQNHPISIGNEGAPTDRQTNQQTDRQTHFTKEDTSGTTIDNAAEILDSLDNMKKEIRLKFKRLTEQEFLIFSTLYQLTEENGHSDYKALSSKLSLTESSIRDYIGKLIKKGIPVEKIKVNNKNIQLSISSNLKKIASLPTILKLREI